MIDVLIKTCVVFAIIIFVMGLGMYEVIKAKPEWFYEESEFSKNFDIKAD